MIGGLLKRAIPLAGIIGFYALAHPATGVEILADDLEFFDEASGIPGGISETLNWGFELHRFVDPVFAKNALRIRNEIYGLDGRTGFYGQSLEILERGSGISARLDKRLAELRDRVEEVQKSYGDILRDPSTSALAQAGSYFIYQENVLRPVSELAYLMSGIDARPTYALQKALYPAHYLSERFRAPAETKKNEKPENSLETFRPDLSVLPELAQYQKSIAAASNDMEKFEKDLRELRNNPSFRSRTWYGTAWSYIWDTISFNWSRFYWDEGMSEQEKNETIAARDKILEKMKAYSPEQLARLDEYESLRQQASFITGANHVETATVRFSGPITSPPVNISAPPAMTREQEYKAAQDRRKKNYIEAVRLLTLSNMINQIDALKKVAHDTTPIRIKDRAPACLARYPRILQSEMNVRMVSETDRKQALSSMIAGSGLIVGTPEFKDFFMSFANPDPVIGSFSGTLPFFQLRIAQQGLAFADGKDPVEDPRDPYKYSNINFLSLGEPGFDDLATYSFVYQQLIGKALSDRFNDPYNEYKQKYALSIFQTVEHTWTDKVEPIDRDVAEAGDAGSADDSAVDSDDSDETEKKRTITLTPFLKARMKTAGTNDWEQVVPASLVQRMEQTRILIPFPPFYGPETYKQWALRLMYRVFDSVPEDKLKASYTTYFLNDACMHLSQLKARKFYADPCAKGLTFAQRISAWKDRFQKFSGKDQVVPPSYVYDDDLRLIWGDLRNQFSIWTRSGLFQEFADEGQPWTNEWEFVKAQMGVNSWVTLRLSFLIAMEIGEVYFDDPDRRVIERFMKKVGKRKVEELTPEEAKEFSSLQIPEIRRRYSFSLDPDFRSALWKAAGVLGIDQPIRPMHANHVLDNKTKKVVWEDIINADNKRSFWALMSKNRVYGDYTNLIDIVESHGLLTKVQVNALRNDMVRSGMETADVDRWLMEAEAHFPKFVAEDYKATSAEEIQDRWKKVLSNLPEDPEPQDGNKDGHAETDLPEALKFEMFLDIWRARGNPEQQMGLLRILKSHYHQFKDDDLKYDIKESFFERDKSFKQPFFEQAYVSASKVRVENLTGLLNEICSFDSNTNEGFKNIYYTSTRFHEQMENDLGLEGTPPEVYKELTRMSDRDKADLWNAAGLMLFFAAFEVSKALCVSPAAPVGCALAAGMAAGAGMAAFQMRILNNRYQEWKDRDRRMKAAKQFREIEFNRDSDVEEFKGGGAGGFVTELFFAATLATPMITSARLVYKSSAAAVKIAAARYAGRALRVGQIRNIVEEIEVDAARSILRLSKASLVSDIVKRVLEAGSVADKYAEAKAGVKGLWKVAGEATEVVESAKQVEVGVAKEVYRNFAGSGEDLSKFIRSEYRTDPKRVMKQLKAYFARPNPSRLKRLAELDPKLYHEIISGTSGLKSAEEAHARFLTDFENLLRGLEQAKGHELVKLMAQNMDALAPYLSKFSFRYSGILQKASKFGRGALFTVTMSGSPWMFSEWPGLKLLSRRAFLKRLISARSKLLYHIEIKPHLVAMGLGTSVMQVDLLDLFSRVRQAADAQLDEAIDQSERIASSDVKVTIGYQVQRAVDDFEMNFAGRILAKYKGVALNTLKPEEIAATRNKIFAAVTVEERLEARRFLKKVKMEDLFHPEMARTAADELVRTLNRDFADLFETLDQTVLRPLISAQSRNDLRRIDDFAALMKLIEKRIEILTIKNRTEAVIVY